MKINPNTIAVMLLFLGGCKDTSIDPSPVLTSSHAVITTKFIDNKPTGFSFASAGIVTIPNNSNTTPDLMILVQRDESGKALGIFF